MNTAAPRRMKEVKKWMWMEFLVQCSFLWKRRAVFMRRKGIWGGFKTSTGHLWEGGSGRLPALLVGFPPALPEAGEDANGQEQGCQGRGVATGVEHLHGDEVASLEGKAPAKAGDGSSIHVGLHKVCAIIQPSSGSAKQQG